MLPTQFKRLVTGLFQVFLLQHKDVIEAVFVVSRSFLIPRLLACSLLLKVDHALGRLLVEPLAQQGHLAQDLQLKVVVLELALVHVLWARDRLNVFLAKLHVEFVQAEDNGRFENQRRQGVQEAVEEHLHGFGKLVGRHFIFEQLEQSVDQVRRLMHDRVGDLPGAKQDSHI